MNEYKLMYNDERCCDCEIGDNCDEYRNILDTFSNCVGNGYSVTAEWDEDEHGTTQMVITIKRIE